MKTIILALALGGMALTPQMAAAQEVPETVVTAMHAAPGKYRAVVEWMAQIDAIRAEAKLAPRQIYRHRNGANWDFFVVEAPLVDGEDEMMEAAAKRLGIKPDPSVFRTIVMDHEDTVVGGPTTGAAILAQMDE